MRLAPATRMKPVDMCEVCVRIRGSGKASRIGKVLRAKIIPPGARSTRLPDMCNACGRSHDRDYVHRVGRTGRAEATGDAFPLVFARAEYRWENSRAAGYTISTGGARGVPGIGANASARIVTDAIAARYGGRVTPGFGVYLTLRPAAMGHQGGSGW